jgi:hypothetical protein
MTKDEARVYLYSAIEEVALHLLSSNEAERAEAREFIDEHLDAFAQAHTDAALADPLALLEVIAKKGDDIIWRGLQVRCIPETGYFLYFRPVRDVALATEQLGQDGMRHSEILAEIKRDLGDSPHG